MFFRILINFRVACLSNVESAAILCCSVAPQALYSDCGLQLYAITLMAFMALWCKFISPCGVRINLSKGFAGFAA
jgi:hypothetical protein